MSGGDRSSDGLGGRVGRWSRRKADLKAGVAPDDDGAAGTGPGRGGAAPVAERAFVAPMVPLADPEDGELDYERAPAEALALRARQRDEAAAAPEAPDEAEEKSLDEQIAELSDEDRQAIEHLPPIDSLDKDSDFTPFFVDGIPEFLQKAAYRALWLSNPLFNFRDGLNDYDENFRLSEKILSAANGDFEAVKGAETDAEGETAAQGEDGEAAATADADAAGAGPGEIAENVEKPSLSDEDAEADDDDLGDADGDEIG